LMYAHFVFFTPKYVFITLLYYYEINIICPNVCSIFFIEKYLVKIIVYYIIYLLKFEYMY